MARKIITCKACKARFDVARYPPGSRVRCGRCSQVLTIPIDNDAGGVTEAPIGRGDTAPAPGRGASKAPERTPPPPRDNAGLSPAPPQGIGGAARHRVVSASGGARSPDRDPLLGATLYDQYQIIRKLGEGGYGAVYEAHDVTLERRMAVKVMLRSRAQNREYVTKFLREARTAAQLSHPNVVGVHGVGFDKTHGLHFLSMEYVEGRTIHDILQERGPLPADDAMEYIAQACRGLGAAHARNIIHRDIKPGNLMVTPAGMVKIADFGLAKVYDPDGAQSTIIGTPYFMPPEQFEGKAKDGRTDIYALGVTFYFMLTMKRPHTGNGPAQILLSVMTQEPKSICEHRPELPEGLWPIVRRMIHKDVDTRYRTCEEIIHDLDALRGGVEPDEEPVYCPACGVPNPLDSEECGKCGESLLETCPACGAEDLAGTKFCGDCGANIPEERAVAALVQDATGMIQDGRLDEADVTLNRAFDRSPENLGVVTARQALDRRREEWSGRADGVRDLLAKGDAPQARRLLDALSAEFPGLADLAVLEGDVRTALAAQDPAAAADAEAQEKARRLEEEGRIREALVAWRGVLVLSPDDEEAQRGERRLATRVERAEALFAEATDELASGDPETAVERLLEANTVLPGDALIEGRMEEARRAAAELSSELAAIEAALVGGGGSRRALKQLASLRGRFPGSALVADAVRRTETAGKEASAEAVRERLERALQQGRVAQQGARPRDALAAWRECVSLDPHQLEAAEGLALAERQLAEFEALLEQARALQQSGDPERGLARAEAALALVPGDPLAEAQIARSRTSLETMRHEAERIRSTLRDDPDEDVLKWAQDLASRFSGSALAAEVLAEVEERFRAVADREAGERLRSLVERGIKLEREGNVRAALSVYEDAVRLAPEDDDSVSAGVSRCRARIDTALQRSAEAAAMLEAGRPEDAQAAARESLELLADQPDAAAIQARARAAAAVIDRAIRSTRDDLVPEAANEQLRRVKDLAARFPGSPRARELLHRAERIVEEAFDAALSQRLGELCRAAEAALDEGRLSDAEAACAELDALREGDADAALILAAVLERRALAADYEAEARAATASGRPAAAAAAFRAALESDPEREGIREALATAERDVAAAEERLALALAAAQGAPDTQRGLRESLAAWEAVLGLDAGHAEAIARATRLGAEITSAEAELARGRELAAAGDPDRALPLVEAAAAALGPDVSLDEGPDLDAELDDLRRARDELVSGLAEIEKLLEADAGDLHGVVSSAEALQRKFPGSDAAAQLLERARAKSLERRHALAVSQVRSLVRERRFGDAVAMATSFREQGVSSPALDAAVRDAEDAAAEIHKLHERLATARAAGQLEEMRDVCREILHSLPDDTAARQTLGEVEETLREVTARRDLAETARRRGDVEEALRLYREVVALHPQSERAVEMLGKLEVEVAGRREFTDAAAAAIRTGDIDDARRHARRLLDRYPDDEDARDLEAIAFGLGRAFEAALRRAERALEQSGDAAHARAAESIDVAERIAPDNPRVARLRARLAPGDPPAAETSEEPGDASTST